MSHCLRRFSMPFMFNSRYAGALVSFPGAAQYLWPRGSLFMIQIPLSIHVSPIGSVSSVAPSAAQIFLSRRQVGERTMQRHGLDGELLNITATPAQHRRARLERPVHGLVPGLPACSACCSQPRTSHPRAKPRDRNAARFTLHLFSIKLS